MALCPNNRPASAVAPPPPAADDYGPRDATGFPQDLLDPVELEPMVDAIKAAVFNADAIFDDKRIVPAFERYNKTSFDRLVAYQRRRHWQRNPWGGHLKTFQPISPCSRLPFVMIEGEPATRPDPATSERTKACLTNDPVLWRALTDAQREAVKVILAEFAMPKHEAVARVLGGHLKNLHCFDALLAEVTADLQPASEMWTCPITGEAIASPLEGDRHVDVAAPATAREPTSAPISASLADGADQSVHQFLAMLEQADRAFS